MSEQVDVVIIGGGPIGLACGIEARKAGLSYVVLEKGCLVNSLYHYPVGMTFFSTSERLEIGDVPFMSLNPKPTRSEALEYYRRVVLHWQLNLKLFEEVVSVQPIEVGYRVLTNKQTYEATYVILATGFYDIPMPLGVVGETLPHVTHYYRDPHFYAFQRVLVIGANNSAVDAALETWRKGAEVTMVVRGETIGERVKYWVKPDIENRIKAGEITAYFNSEVKEIREKEVVIATPEGDIVQPIDWILAMTGYQPNLSFLQKIGIALHDDPNRTPVFDAETMETNLPNVFLAGVVCGGLNTHRLFIENSRVHAQQIMEQIVLRQPSA